MNVFSGLRTVVHGNLKFFKLLGISIFFSLSISVIAQNPQIDSLKTVIELLKDDSVKVNALNELSLNLWNSNPDLSIMYGREALELGNNINFKKGVAYALKNIGLGYYTKSDYRAVLENWQRSLAVFDSLGDDNGISNLLNNIGSVYINQGDDAKAIDYFLRALKVAEDNGDSLRIASAWLNIGNLYINKVETHDKSLEYLLKGLRLSKKLGAQDAIENAIVNIGEIYFLRGNYDSALVYFERSLKVSEIDGSGTAPYSLNSIGKVYQKRGDFSTAIKYHEQAYEMSKQMDDELQISQSLIGLGKTYSISKKYTMAIKSYKEAEIHALEIGALKELNEIYIGVSNVYSIQKDFANAFNYQALLTQINYDLYNSENDKKIERMQFSYDIEKKQDEIEDLTKEKKLQDLEIQQQKYVNYAAIIAGIVLFILAGGMFNRYRFIRRTKKIIEQEKERSDKLLLNILPAETAEELKENGTAKARSYSNVTILFTDFKGFTALSATLSPQDLVKEIHHCYKAFDEIMAKYKVEKIKTIGDAYMAAGGLPIANKTHPFDVTLAAMEIRGFMNKLKEERTRSGKPYFEIRIGIHSGPVVAGVVGTHKFAYDIWGDAVNIASRMESNSEPGKINISESTYDLIKDQFECTPRGKIAVKGAGEKSMYFIENRLSTQLINNR